MHLVYYVSKLFSVLRYITLQYTRVLSSPHLKKKQNALGKLKTSIPISIPKAPYKSRYTNPYLFLLTKIFPQFKPKLEKSYIIHTQVLANLLSADWIFNFFPRHVTATRHANDISVLFSDANIIWMWAKKFFVCIKGSTALQKHAHRCKFRIAWNIPCLFLFVTERLLLFWYEILLKYSERS